MKLNHIDLPVIDPTSVRSFFERHFDIKCVFSGDNGALVQTNRVEGILANVDADHCDFR